MVSTTGVALSIVFPILAIIAVGGRFYSRRAKNLPIQADDWTILPGLVGLSYSSVLNIADIRQLCAVGIGALGLVGMFELSIPSLLTAFLTPLGMYDGDVGTPQPKGPNGIAIISPKFEIFEKVRAFT